MSGQFTWLMIDHIDIVGVRAQVSRRFEENVHLIRRMRPRFDDHRAVLTIKWKHVNLKVIAYYANVRSSGIARIRYSKPTLNSHCTVRT